MLQRFRGFDAHEVLGDEVLQNLKIAFTVSLHAHTFLNALSIWLTLIKACMSAATILGLNCCQDV